MDHKGILVDLFMGALLLKSLRRKDGPIRNAILNTQKADRYLHIFNRLMQKNDQLAAAKYAVQAFRITQKSMKEIYRYEDIQRSSVAPIAISSLGVIQASSALAAANAYQYARGHGKQALRWINKAIDLVDQGHPMVRPVVRKFLAAREAYFTAGMILRDIGKINEAEENFTKQIREAEYFFGPFCKEKINALCGAMVTAYEQGDVSKAYRMHSRSLDCISFSLGQPKVAEDIKRREFDRTIHLLQNAEVTWSDLSDREVERLSL